MDAISLRLVWRHIAACNSIGADQQGPSVHDRSKALERRNQPSGYQVTRMSN
jgi:hypothetical protein